MAFPCLFHQKPLFKYKSGKKIVFPILKLNLKRLANCRTYHSRVSSESQKEQELMDKKPTSRLHTEQRANQSKVEETIAGGADGMHTIWVCLAKPSTTVYVCPKVDVT